MSDIVAMIRRGDRTMKLDADAGQCDVTVDTDGVFLQMMSNDIERPDFIRLTRAEWEQVQAFVDAKPSWQPIAMAPKHARAIVCGGIRNCFDGYHDVQTAWIDGCGNVWADDRKEGSAPITPTHWMPAPEPPK